MIRALGAVGDLIWVTLADRPYICGNRTCAWRLLTATAWKRTRLTNSDLRIALAYGRRCGWCGHTMRRDGGAR